MVVGTGFEPVNSKAERIYSPRPLATWIPYRPVNYLKYDTDIVSILKLFFQKFLLFCFFDFYTRFICTFANLWQNCTVLIIG